VDGHKATRDRRHVTAGNLANLIIPPHQLFLISVALVKVLL
jgi:hypothetical protein